MEKEAKELIEKMMETIKKADLLIGHPQFCLEEDRDELINEVDIQREVLIDRIHKISNSQINRIKEFYAKSVERSTSDKIKEYSLVIQEMKQKLALMKEQIVNDETDKYPRILLSKLRPRLKIN